MSLLPTHVTVYSCASAPGTPAGTTLTRFVATVATAVATAVATGPFCVATVATAKQRFWRKSVTYLFQAVATVATQNGPVATAVATVATKRVRVVPAGIPGADAHKYTVK